MRWFFMEGSQKLGPFEELSMEAAIKGRTILPSTMVWGEGMDDWDPAVETELKQYFKEEQLVSSNPRSGDILQPPPLPISCERREQGKKHSIKLISTAWGTGKVAIVAAVVIITGVALNMMRPPVAAFREDGAGYDRGIGPVHITNISKKNLYHVVITGKDQGDQKASVDKIEPGETVVSSPGIPGFKVRVHGYLLSRTVKLPDSYKENPLLMARLAQ